jgi:hypothetical protein
VTPNNALQPTGGIELIFQAQYRRNAFLLGSVAFPPAAELHRSAASPFCSTNFLRARMLATDNQTSFVPQHCGA